MFSTRQTPAGVGLWLGEICYTCLNWVDLLFVAASANGSTWGYNHGVQVQGVATVVILGAGLIAQVAPRPCPADRPVDEIIAEVHSQQSKKKHRNANPFPEVTCIWGWCREHSRTPPTIPAPAPRAEIPSGDNRSSSSISSSRIPVGKCNEAMDLALEAAQNVDVGDYSFAEKNYRGALLRYMEAVDQKPGDAAIHARLGRVFEKLDQLPQAIEQYSAAQRVAGPAKWRDEARTALLRLQRAAETPMLQKEKSRKKN